MLADTKAFSGFSVTDIDAAKKFYGETLGLKVTDEDMGLVRLHLAGGTEILVYPKPNHEPATYTILNFVVDDIDTTVDQLTLTSGTRKSIHTWRLKYQMLWHC